MLSCICSRQSIKSSFVKTILLQNSGTHSKYPHGYVLVSYLLFVMLILELENHMNVHRAVGGAVKRGRGRPKGSKSKKPATESAVLNTTDTTASTKSVHCVPVFYENGYHDS